MPEDANSKAISFVEPAVLLRIRSIELRAKVVVEGFWKGIHSSPYHGFSVEFSEYRPYVPGDDSRHIDWRLYARTDRLYVKRFADETNMRCLLVVDQSRSMAYGSKGYSKCQYAGTLAAAIGYLLFGQGDAVGLATFDRQIRTYSPPRNRPGYLKRLLAELDKAPEGPSTDLRSSLQGVWQLCIRRQMVILISDLMANIEHMDADLGYLRAAGHDLIIFHVLDPTELTLQIGRSAILEDMETGRRMLIDPAVASDHYARRLNEHLCQLRSICQALGIDYQLCPTDRPFELSLFELLQHRAFAKRRMYRPCQAARRST